VVGDRKLLNQANFGGAPRVSLAVPAWPPSIDNTRDVCVLWLFRLVGY
jgi:hypothetical protein